MGVSIVVVRPLMEELEHRGFDGAAFCAEVGLDPAALEDPLRRLDYGQYARIVAHALSVTGDPHLGLHVGARTPDTALTVLGHLAIACKTLREAERLLEQYGSLVLEDAEFGLHVDDRVATFFYRPSSSSQTDRIYATEYLFAVIYRVASRFTPTPTVYEIRFSYDEPWDLTAYEQVFRCPVHFGTERDEIRFDPKMLDVPQRHGDEVVVELLKPRADELLSALHAPSALPSRVRDFIRTARQPSKLDAPQVAAALGMAERTLRRHLRRSGTTIRDLIESTLRDMACSALKESHVPIKEVAHRLGFSGASTFHRAFKRWTGLTPSEYRASGTRN